jgi:hypothetical protein
MKPTNQTFSFDMHIPYHGVLLVGLKFQDPAPWLTLRTQLKKLGKH